ncbi:MAG TPA: helix-turn-helix transcriptional regulator [Verrucomicrobiota bacterium]|nr:helix-turn-helix transcriptional regulator [Verrucomicrobiota bacterium]
MSTVAVQLREAREARNLTIHQVAEATKIRTDHIRALEEGNYDVFAAPVYIRGFVRAYAQLLKLDSEQVMASLDDELSDTEKFREPPPLTDRSNGVLDIITLQLSKVNWRKSLVVLGVLLVIGGVIAAVSLWLHHRDADPLADLPPGVYQSQQPGTGEVVPAPRGR